MDPPPLDPPSPTIDPDPALPPLPSDPIRLPAVPEPDRSDPIRPVLRAQVFVWLMGCVAGVRILNPEPQPSSTGLGYG